MLHRRIKTNLSCWPKFFRSFWFVRFIICLDLLSPLVTHWYLFLPKSWARFLSKSWREVKALAMYVQNISPPSIAMHHIKHAISVLCLLSTIVAVWVSRGGLFTPPEGSDFNPVDRYGLVGGVVLYLLHCLVLVPFPFFAFNFLGVVLMNVFTPRPKLQRSPLLVPFLCFRVVTRGLFPDLVNKNVQHNLKVLNKIGLQNYILEVVTDISIDLKKVPRTREIIVPLEYKTSQGSLFKARALQYALEPEVDILSQGDWIVHLDEETLLTEDAVIGIINFVGSGKYHFGQGVITYGRGHIVNWVTTLADSIRVGIDYGALRFTLGILHKPIFSWKGSFIVADAEAEKHISFDHGPEGSLAEDCFFACVAFKEGYSFGIVEGEMLEKSTFTMLDFIRQRRRWMQGILETALSRKIPFRYKIGPVLMSFAGCTMPLNIILLPLSMIYPMPHSPLLMNAYSFVIGTIIYLFLLGTMRTFCIKKHGVFKFFVLVLATMACALIAAVLENISSVLVFWAPRSSSTSNGFYVVNKQIQTECVKYS